MPRSVLLPLMGFVKSFSNKACFIIYMCALLQLNAHAASLAPSGQSEESATVDGAVILQYHHISEKTPPSTSTTPSKFAEHLELIEQQGFTVKSLPWVIQQLQQKKPLPNKTVAITFDDGYLSIYEAAFPLLKERNWPFTIFISPEPIDKGFGDALNWDQLKEMQDAGATIANHSYEHNYLLERLTNSNGETESEAEWLARTKKDILDTEQRLLEKLGTSHKLIAYPYGEYNSALQTLVQELGFIGLGQQSGPVGFYSDMTALPRFPAAGIYANPVTLKTKMYTQPFHVLEQTQSTELADDEIPSLKLVLSPNGFRSTQIQCFYQGKTIDTQTVTTNIDGQQQIQVKATASALGKSRRHRYNCTAPAKDGKRYYWFSHSWLRSSEQDG